MAAPPPSHKLIPGCGFLVDGFRHAGHPSVKAYFLTHAHSDHYTGLTDAWRSGAIYCSEVTARLIKHMLGVQQQWLVALPLDTPTAIQGVEVTLVSANHCPGAVQMLFRLPDGRKYVHTGDMRFSPSLLQNPHIQSFRGCDALYLDTTYCNPRYCFPKQKESIEYVAGTIHRLLQEDVAAEQEDAAAQAAKAGQQVQQDAAAQAAEAGEQQNTAVAAGPGQQQQQQLLPGSSAAAGLASPPQQQQQAVQPAGGWRYRRVYCIATYGIGKERILTAVHDRCDVRLHVADRKHAIMQRLDLPGYDPAQLFTTARGATPVHVVQWGFLGETWPFFRPNYANMEALRRELGAEEVVGFVPTGWLFEMKKELFSVRCKGACSVHLVPYSEHSSYAELLEYVKFLRPHQVVPTVGVGGNDADKARTKMLKHFTGLVDETASRAKFLQAFHRAAAGNGSSPGSASASAGVASAAARGQQQQQQRREQEEERRQRRDHQQEQQEQEMKQVDGEDIVNLLESEEEEEYGTPGGRTPVVAGTAEAVADPAAIAAVAAVGSSGAGEAAGPSEPHLQQLLAVLGDEVSPQQGRQLLAAARGDLQSAINGWLDGTSAAAAAGGTAGKEAGVSASPAGGSSSQAGTKRPALLAAPGGGCGKRQKKGSGAAAGGQTSIFSFLKPQCSPRPQQQRQQSQPPQQKQSHGAAEAAAAGTAAAKAAAEAEGGGDLAVTPSAPMAASPAASDAVGRTAEGMPRPAAFSHASPGGASGQRFFLGARGSGAAGGGGGGRGADRAAAVPRDAAALPLDKYDPVGHAPWEQGQPVPYLHLARAFEAMDSTTKRLRISDVLTNCFRSVLALAPPAEAVLTAYLACGRIGPDYQQGNQLNVGPSVVSGAIVEATGVSKTRLSELYRDLGDAGDVAQACKQRQAVLQRPAPLTVLGVFATLQQIAREKGQGAAGRRQRAVLSLLRACRESETKYVVRTLVQNLRVGANWRSVVPALGKAVVMHREGPGVPKGRLDAAAAAATAAFHVCPNLQLLADAMRAHPFEEWEARCPLTPGVPVKPMLAKICEGLPDALRQLAGAPFLAEYKYDGQRAQIHLTADGQVRIFSRNSEDKSEQFPDVAQQVLAAAQGGATSAIIDAEVVPVDRESGRLRSFQELATRGRTQGVEASSDKVPVCIFAFDLLFLNGTSLLHLPLSERCRRLLEALPNLRPGYCQLAQSIQFAGVEGPQGATHQPPAPEMQQQQQQQQQQTAAAAAAQQDSGGGAGAHVAGADVADTVEADSKVLSDAEVAGVGVAEAAEAPAAALPLEERLQECLLEAFAAGTEGLMLKSLATPYQPSRRSDHWLKLKRDYCKGLHDTLDLVVIGAWHGNGRKTGWYSPYLLACWDPETEELQSVCRCMSGFSDAFYRASLERLQQTVIPGPRPFYRTDETPSVWFDAKEVWEIKGADLTISPVHKAALGRVHSERGLGLRFPRFLQIRQDKAPEDATTAEQIAEMFQAQTRKVETAGQRLVAQRQPRGQQVAEVAEIPGPPGSVAAVASEAEDSGEAGGSSDAA